MGHSIENQPFQPPSAPVLTPSDFAQIFFNKLLLLPIETCPNYMQQIMFIKDIIFLNCEGHAHFSLTLSRPTTLRACIAKLVCRIPLKIGFWANLEPNFKDMESVWASCYTWRSNSPPKIPQYWPNFSLKNICFIVYAMLRGVTLKRFGLVHKTS